MASRMDRYRNNSSEPELTRSNKNQELYQNIGTNAKYTNFTDVRDSNTYTINPSDNSYTRENYQQLKEYTNITPKKTRIRKEFDDFNNLYNINENKIYDINSVLEKAKENRKESESNEKLRKLKNTNYNILASINPEELEKYRQEKRNRLKPDTDDELKGLIDTTISKTLAGEISKQATVDLLSDLMATNALDMISASNEVKEESKNIVEEEPKKEIKEEKKPSDKLNKDDLKKIEESKKDLKDLTEDDIMKDLDKSFYTRSMDLSDKDFFIDEDDTDRKIPLVVKIMLFIVLVSIIAVGVYFLYQSF